MTYVLKRVLDGAYLADIGDRPGQGSRRGPLPSDPENRSGVGAGMNDALSYWVGRRRDAKKFENEPEADRVCGLAQKRWGEGRVEVVQA